MRKKAKDKAIPKQKMKQLEDKEEAGLFYAALACSRSRSGSRSIC